jgi:hypothetical protein
MMNDGSCLASPLASSSLLAGDFEKTLKTFFRLGASFLSEFKFFIQKEVMFEL